MAVFERLTKRPGGNASGASPTVFGLVARLAVLALVDTFAVWFITNLINNGAIMLGIAFSLVTLVANVILLRSEAYPLRWMLLGLVMLTMFSIYPIIYTVYVAFTNYGDGHLLTKEQAIRQLQREKFLAEGGRSFTWTAFRSTAGDFALWLQNADGEGFLARPGAAITAGSGEITGLGELDEDGIPLTLEGYTRLNRIQLVRYIGDLGLLSFGEGDFAVQVRNLDEAAELTPRYEYDAATDAITDQQTGQTYTPINGTFTSPSGAQLVPGFSATIGLENFRRFFTSPALRGPLLQIVSWNFAFAFLSVFLSFALGLLIAMMYSDKDLLGRKLIRTLLLIPYTVPSLITILIWRGMMNPELGVINRVLESLFSWSPPWFTDPSWAKIGVLLVNLWLGYPYFMLVCSGALQAIPEDIYGAAEVDGANIWQRFYSITLPLLLVTVGPLLVASFVFNFNNFNIIFLFIQGGPPIAGAATRAGHTDILISYVYNLAFAGGRGADYGLASAITIVIFFVVAIITLFQFRFTRMWEEVGENV